MPHHTILYIILACIFGLSLTWGVGANDLANVLSTSIGSKAISARQAIIIAIIFEFAGAFLGGSGVTETMRNGIIDTSALTNDPDILIYGMLAVLFASMVWMNFASYLGFPVSVTNAIVGSVVGFGCIVLGPNTIHWQQVFYIIISWISAPTIACFFSYFLLISIQRAIFAKPDPIQAARHYLPFYLFLVGVVLANMIVLKGIDHFNITFNHNKNVGLVFVTGLLVVLAGMKMMNKLPSDSQGIKRRLQFIYVEKMFAILMVFTAAAMIFAHGSNDVSIAVGPMTIVVSLVQHDTHSALHKAYPAWITLLGVTGIVLGLIFYGRKVIETVGKGITALTPSRAYAATIAAATTVVISTSTGIPVSATQTLVGGVLGAGLARGIAALDMIVIRNIFMSWLLTIPAASILTIICYFIFKIIFDHLLGF